VACAGATRDAAAAEAADEPGDLFSLPGSLPDLPPLRRPASSSRTSGTSRSADASASLGDGPATPSARHSQASLNEDTLSLSMPRLPDPMADLFGAK
jgi:hypothetical protein